MNYAIDHNISTPAYLQIYGQLRNDIISGAYPYGAKIPSKRILASEFSVSVITVMHAIDLLCEEGYLETRQRSGYFVIFKQDDFIGSPADSVSRSSYEVRHGEAVDFPFTVAAKTMRKVILDYDSRILVKSPNFGCMELRLEICSYLARSRSIYVHPDQVIIGSGAEYLYGLIAQFFGNQSRFAIENPSYHKIRDVYDAFHVDYDLLTLRDDGIDSEELWTTTARVMHTTPFHSFPTGVSIDSSKKHEYLRWASRNNGVIIEDNYDSELTVSSKPEDSLFAISSEQNVIYLNTFSKTIAPSIRIGYMILPEALLQDYQTRLGFYSCPVPTFDQFVLTEFLRSGDFERHINRVRRQKRKELNPTSVK